MVSCRVFGNCYLAGMMLNGKARKTGYCWQDEINRKTKAEGVDIANDELLVKRNRLDSIGGDDK